MIAWPKLVHLRSSHLTSFNLSFPSPKSLVLFGSIPCAACKEEEHYSSFSSPSSSSSGLGFEGVVGSTSSKVRLDSWLASQLPHISRARVATSIRQGLAHVNGQPVTKASHTIHAGDHVKCVVSPLLPLKADPEDLVLDIIYEDECVLVVNKPPHMVTHPAPGNLHGTLVNAILHHCELPSVAPDQTPLKKLNSEGDDCIADLEEEDDMNPLPTTLSTHYVRPGIVHRLDKGTSGLLVVAKDAYAHEHLSEQFKSRKVKRSYVSLTCGIPPSQAGRVDVPIGRDIHNRIRMAAIHSPNASKRGRIAASRYKVIEVLANGGSAFVVWRLETGRTHQIRVHAQYLGYPLLGDELYGGTKGAALSCLLPKLPSCVHNKAKLLVNELKRPCLHAHTLGFFHPYTGQELSFTCPVPVDFEQVWQQLQKLSSSSN